MSEEGLKIYLAGASSMVEDSRKLRDRLQSSMHCRVLLPQDHISCDKENEPKEWASVFGTCKGLMDSADCIVINLAQFGRDTAAEIGYSYGRGKPIIGFALEADYEGDAIVRGFLQEVQHDEDSLIAILQALSERRLTIDKSVAIL